MTAESIYKTALGLMSETPAKAKGYAELVVPTVNFMLGDCFRENNTIRAGKGKEELSEIPEISDISQEVPFESELCRVCLVNGLAGYLLLDDDTNKAGYFLEKYDTAKSSYKRAVLETVEDVY